MSRLAQALAAGQQKQTSQAPLRSQNSGHKVWRFEIKLDSSLRMLCGPKTYSVLKEHEKKLNSLVSGSLAMGGTSGNHGKFEIPRE